MPRAEYLVDTSALARARQPAVAGVLTSLATRGSIAVSGPVVFEMGVTGKTNQQRTTILDGLVGFPYIDTVEADQRRAVEIQTMLASSGRHRALSLVDALVAAAAERVDLAVLHYDSDFERIADVTGQRHTWVVPRGSAY